MWSGLQQGRRSELKYSYAKAQRIFQCSACRTQTLVKAGTNFHKARRPPVKWLLAICLLMQSKNDIAELNWPVKRGVKCGPARLVKQKCMETMRLRNRNYQLKGYVQLDDTYLGGERPGKRGARSGLPCCGCKSYSRYFVRCRTPSGDCSCPRH